MFKTKKFWYILLFGILYLIVAFSSFFHAVSFFGLANNPWMSIILAFAFEIGQAAVLFSLLTSEKDRSRIMPWILMTMFTLVQVIGNVFSSYKYIINNSVEDLRYFKEPIFIWTSIPDEQATVIIVYLVGALLPIASLLLTSMITNYLSDESEKTDKNIIINENDNNRQSNIKEETETVQDSEKQSKTDSSQSFERKEPIEEENREPVNDDKQVQEELNTEENTEENTEKNTEKTKSHFINL